MQMPARSPLQWRGQRKSRHTYAHAHTPTRGASGNQQKRMVAGGMRGVGVGWVGWEERGAKEGRAERGMAERGREMERWRGL